MKLQQSGNSVAISEVKHFIQNSFLDRKPLAYIHTFGCQQNVSDSEKIKGVLSQLGYTFTDSDKYADLIIYNTCAVRENAEDKVFGNVGELKHLKEKNPHLVIGICGCMVQQKHITDKILKTYKQVDLIFGTHALNELHQLLYSVLKDRIKSVSIDNQENIIDEAEYVVRDSKFKASVPIMFGCNNFCTYCIVPFVRGREKSRSSRSIISEIKGLVQNGYKEIMLLGQNVNSYGNGLDENINFSGLLRLINSIEGDFQIRFISSHPKDATYELIDTIIDCEKVCNHLHLPFQSGSNKILEKMNRHYTIEKYYEIVDYARSRYSEFSFSSDIIVGFPGELYEDFLQTIIAIKRVKFDNLFTFVYSKRSGTKAAEFPDPISDEQKGLWTRELITQQRKVAVANYKRFLGRTIKVLTEDRSKNHPEFLVGKSNENIICEFKGDENLIGTFVDIYVTDTFNWAVKGEIINKRSI